MDCWGDGRAASDGDGPPRCAAEKGGFGVSLPRKGTRSTPIGTNVRTRRDIGGQLGPMWHASVNQTAVLQSIREQFLEQQFRKSYRDRAELELDLERMANSDKDKLLPGARFRYVM